MACFHPLRAWRTQSGHVQLSKEAADSDSLRLPCGNCLGCRMARAKEWALRCHLELQVHDSAVFSTLTYNDKNLPATLDRRHVQLFLKRLRKSSDGAIRFFASGEYGEKTERPHYHALLYGVSERDRDKIEETWRLGHTHTVPITPAAIAYVAGYAAKKIGYTKRAQEERVDPETGEVYYWQPPFIQMSRRPGIGGHARQWPQSWRTHAVHNGSPMPVPRFLHESWKQQATPQQLEDLLYEKTQCIKKDSSAYSLNSREQLAIQKQSLQASKRSY